jgi:hypothetical protein
MNKFKVGDRVRILTNNRKGIRLHQEAIIVDIGKHGSYLDFGKDGYRWYFFFEEFEKVETNLEWDN